MSACRTKYPAQRVLLILVLFFIVFLNGVGLIKYYCHIFFNSAKNVPNWMVDGYYSAFTNSDVGVLHNGLCENRPIFIYLKNDGSALLICGEPFQFDPVLLFVANSILLGPRTDSLN